MNDIHIVLDKAQRDALTLFQHLGGKLSQSLVIANRIGSVHVLTKLAKEIFGAELADIWYRQYFKGELNISGQLTVSIRNIRNLTLEAPISTTEKGPFPEILKDRLNLTILTEPPADNFNANPHLSSFSDLSPKILEHMVQDSGLQNANPILTVLALNINHYLSNAPLEAQIKNAYRKASSGATKLYSYLQLGFPLPTILMGEALLLKDLKTEFEFEDYFSVRFREIELHFYGTLTRTVLSNRGIDLSIGRAATDASELIRMESLFSSVEKEGISFANPEPQIQKVFGKFQESGGGKVNKLILEYLNRIGAKPRDFDQLSTNMALFLKSLSLDPNILTATEPTGEGAPVLDELFGPAYIHAKNLLAEDHDPVRNIFSSRNIDDWDFSVQTFEELEEQGITPSNIKAAGALYYIYELGDRLGVFRLTDMLVLMWAQGRLDLDRSSTVTDQLYRYYKFRDDRISPEERAMVYRMTLNKGSGNLLSRMIPNEDFTHLWQQLMSEVVDYIQKSERHQTHQNLVSQYGIFQATRNLQYNLTTHMVGKPLMDTQEMYAQIQECFAILKHQDITRRLAGGSHSNMWGVIENLSRQEFGHVPNISASRTVAVEGNKIFQWISDFKNPDSRTYLTGSSPESFEFRNFLNAAEAFILAQGQLEQGGGGMGAKWMGNGSQNRNTPPNLDVFPESEPDNGEFDFEEVEEVPVDEFQF